MITDKYVKVSHFKLKVSKSQKGILVSSHLQKTNENISRVSARVSVSLVSARAPWLNELNKKMHMIILIGNYVIFHII